MTGPILHAAGISVIYGRGAARVVALRQVSLRLDRGEIVLIMGPSGSGKTTLLLALGGLLKPDEGEVRIDGHSTAALSQPALSALRLRRYGFVFQAYHLFPTLRAWENVAIALDLRGIGRTEAERRSCMLLDQMDLSRQVRAFPAELSGGQKQRLAIARALAGDPAVILADEPTGALDSVNGLRIGETLRDLAHRDHRAVLLVTHDSRLVPLADRIVTLEDGQITAPAEDHPA